MALASCVADDVDKLSLADRVPVEFSLGTQASFTRASTENIEFDENEVVKVCVKSGGDSYAPYDYKTSKSGSSNIGLTAPETPPYFPAGTSTKVRAYAYYPSTAGSTFSVSTSQNDNSEYKKSDLMYAANREITKGVTDENNELVLAHQMAQLKIDAKAADGSGLTINSVVVNAKYQVAFTPDGETITTTKDSKTDITAATAGGVSYVLVPVQKISDVTIKVGVSESSEEAEYTFNSSDEFQKRMLLYRQFGCYCGSAWSDFYH